MADGDSTMKPDHKKRVIIPVKFIFLKQNGPRFFESLAQADVCAWFADACVWVRSKLLVIIFSTYTGCTFMPLI